MTGYQFEEALERHRMTRQSFADYIGRSRESISRCTQGEARVPVYIERIIVLMDMVQEKTERACAA